jgi:hypothetical protein
VSGCSGTAPSSIAAPALKAPGIVARDDGRCGSALVVQPVTLMVHMAVAAALMGSFYISHIPCPFGGYLCWLTCGSDVG